MKLNKRVPSGREKDQAAVELLERLREKLYCDNPSAARHAAFTMSWMQEDGFEILKEALFGGASRTAKGAAAYGLRKMRGRMKKQAFELLEAGVKHDNTNTRQVCARALSLEKESKQSARQPQPASQPPKYQAKPKFRISEISHKSPRELPGRSRRNPPRMSGFNH
jgi:hypothetical protein